jgi:hypothetical protein
VPSVVSPGNVATAQGCAPLDAKAGAVNRRGTLAEGISKHLAQSNIISAPQGTVEEKVNHNFSHWPFINWAAPAFSNWEEGQSVTQDQKGELGRSSLRAALSGLDPDDEELLTILLEILGWPVLPASTVSNRKPQKLTALFIGDSDPNFDMSQFPSTKFVFISSSSADMKTCMNEDNSVFMLQSPIQIEHVESLWILLHPMSAE